MGQIGRTLPILVCTLCLFANYSCKKRYPEVKPIYTGSLCYNRDFNDLHPLHQQAAAQIGVKVLANRVDAERHKQRLKKITNTTYYEVRNLTHSIPFLVPEAKELVNDIGFRFRKRLKELDAPLYRLHITSVTRTQEDVAKLRKQNLNASESSVHMHATTIDISWSKFSKIDNKDPRTLTPDQLKKVLGLVLYEIKREGKAFVKHEKQQACFHITARPLTK